MAGFDFEFEYDGDSGYELAHRLLRHLQLRARHFGLDLHYKVRRDESSYYVTVDGPLTGMQAFAPRLSLEVFVCAEFADRPKPAWRRTDLAWDILEEYRSGLEGITDAVNEVARMFTPILSGLAPSPQSLMFDRTDVPSHLHGPLRRFEATLATYANLPVMLLPTLPIEEAHAVEEAHTATELLLRTAIGVKSLSYAQMTDRALERSWLDPKQHAQLIALKDLRKGVKHRAMGLGQMGAFDLVMNAVECSHLLLRPIAGRAK
jgi:hypothetical protein